MEGFSLSDTTVHFIDAEPAEALRQAKAAADGKDVRLGGGVSTVRAFLEADLVDTMHVAVAPVELGRGGKLRDSPDELLDRFHLERIPSPSGVTHHLFWPWVVGNGYSTCSLLHLLVEEHPDQQREGVGVQEAIGLGVAGDGEIALHGDRMLRRT